MKVRPPAVAGMFYPDDPVRLRQMVGDLLADAATRLPDRAGTDEKPVAFIVPHAGYIYSGSTAAMAYAQLADLAEEIRHVVIVGPTHRIGIQGIGLPGVESMATPLGQIPVWPEGVAIAREQPSVVVSAAAHAQEHSLEVQLPFLQVVLPDADVLPLAAGWVEPAAVAGVLGALWDEPGTMTLISSDLSHYHPYDEARAIDRATVERILRLDATIDHDLACGATGINALLLVARERGLTPRLDHLCNSGDTAGAKDGVVGYAEVSFMERVRP